jgi:EAL domain-containing protein (putative c-di-GMP-specific phosphodiesterase class I)
VDRIDRSDGDAAIVRAMVTIGHALGSRLVAEGVERPDQAELLRAWGCQSAQGFLFSEALPAEEAARMLLSGGLLRSAGAV